MESLTVKIEDLGLELEYEFEEGLPSPDEVKAAIFEAIRGIGGRPRDRGRTTENT